jgi:archaeosortase A (PGF-CTERM-specific)
MILKSALPFIAILLFLLALVFRNNPFLKRKRLRKEPSSFPGEISFPEVKFEKVTGALGWVFIAFYCYSEAFDYFAQEEYFDASLALVFLAFSLFLALLLVRPGENEDLFFTVTKVALITSVFYFPFSEISFLGDSLIYITAKITTMVLNLFNVGVYMVPLSSIYTTNSSFHEAYNPIVIILACTAIQSMVLFIGLIFGVNAPLRRKQKAFLVSVPVIYGLNIFRNVFVTAAYFGQWFGSPLQSFDIAHGVIARIGAMILLIIVAYAVFVILPEALNLVEEFFHFIFRKNQ